jgi:DNA-binding beta-propeller fold protein YncE
MDAQCANEAEREKRVGAVLGSSDRRRSGRRVESVSEVCADLRRRSVAVPCVLLGALLLGVAPAFGASQRGHVFSFAFGSLGKSSGQFFHPSGVAVEDASGDVYVADRENGRLEKFEPVMGGGELVGETPVSAASFSAEVTHPEAVAVDNCTEAGSTTPCSQATDPSVGAVYVVGAAKGEAKASEPKDDFLFKFSATGVALARLKFKNSIEGVAVDSSGTVFVYQMGGTITKLSNAAVNVAESSVQAGVKEPQATGFAVDAEGARFYLGAVASEDETGGDGAVGGLLHELEREATPVVSELEASTGNVLVHEFDYEVSTAVAVNPTNDASNTAVNELGDVYIDNVAHNDAGEEVTTVAAFSPEETAGPEAEGEGKLIQRFGAPGLAEGDGIALDPDTGAVFVSDGAANRVDVFELEPPGAPSIGDVSATSTDGATTLSARVDPAGASTEYSFEYGSASCVSVPSVCTKTASTPVGGGFADTRAEAELTGLEPGIYHYRALATNSLGTVDSVERTFTVVATLGTLPDGRAWELVSPPETNGAEAEPIRHEGGLVQASANGDAITFTADGPMPAKAEPEGNRNPETTQILATRNREPGHETWSAQDITTPNETGAGPTTGEAQEYRIFSSNLALAIVAPYPAVMGRYARPPLSPLLPGEEAGKQETTIYLRANGPTDVLQPEASQELHYDEARKNGEAMDNAGFLALVSKANAPGPEFGRELTERGLRPQAATPDLSHILYRFENAGPARGLYEWGDGESHLVSVLPDGEELHTGHEETYFGGSFGSFEEPNNVRHAVSDNGARVFWTDAAIATGETHLEVRERGETTEPETLQLDTSQGGPAEGKANAVFQTASADGRKVFFTDEQRLTSDSGAEEDKPDLYVAELEVVGGHLLSHLVDLTAMHHEGAEVLVNGKKAGGVIGASEDGAYVYFVADGALAPGASRGYCGFKETGERRPPGTTCNLYVRHYDEAARAWEPTKLVAAVSFEDSPDWGDFGQGPLSYMTSRVSPDGRYLAFMSDRSLTGYDNKDVSSEAPGKRLDEEVFLYDAQQERLVCASCNPTGARPRGVFDAGLTNGGKGEGLGLVVDRNEVWSAVTSEQEGGIDAGIDNWLAGSIPGWTNVGGEYATYQSRYLSNSGRLFFNSADPLVPLATPTREETVEGVEQEVGVENVYEYEPNTIGACHSEGGCIGLISSGKSEHESAFLDASESGNDVFFLTSEQLVPAASEKNFAVYDAHVCEAGSPCQAPAPPSKEACAGEEACQGSVPATEPRSPSGTSIFSGPGNLVLPKGGVLPEKTVVAPPSKPLTRAQKLVKALRTCRKDKQRTKRAACEKQARGRYGPLKTAKAKKSASRGAGR